MSAQQRYAGLSQAERRQAAMHVRRVSDRQELTQTRLDVFAELVVWGILDDGQPPAYWVYCWELASRVYGLRRAAGIVAGAR